MALTNLARVELVRPPVPGGSFSDDPGLLAQATAALDSASAWFETMIGYTMALSARSYLMSGNGTSVLKVPDYPIVTVTSLKVDGSTWTVLFPGGTDTGQDAAVHDSRKWLVARYRYWPKGLSNIALATTAGLATIPEDVQQAVAMLAWLLLEESNRLGINATSLGPEHVNMVARDADDYQFIKTTISRYSREW